MDVSEKQQQEKQTVEKMIQLYCKKNHHTKSLCMHCETLKTYAFQRIDVCPFMETKTFCSNCKVHCYQKEKREEVRRVMRYSGPRMLLYNPWMAIRHVIVSRKEKKL